MEVNSILRAPRFGNGNVKMRGGDCAKNLVRMYVMKELWAFACDADVESDGTSNWDSDVQGGQDSHAAEQRNERHTRAGQKDQSTEE
jgi:hypothetical protein